MTDGVSTMSRKGQVTVPIAIRKALGIKQGDKVAFVLENGRATLTHKPSYTDMTKGILKTDQPPLTAEELRDVAEQAFVDEVIERSGG